MRRLSSDGPPRALDLAGARPLPLPLHQGATSEELPPYLTSLPTPDSSLPGERSRHEPASVPTPPPGGSEATATEPVPGPACFGGEQNTRRCERGTHKEHPPRKETKRTDPLLSMFAPRLPCRHARCSTVACGAGSVAPGGPCEERHDARLEKKKKVSAVRATRGQQQRGRPDDLRGHSRELGRSDGSRTAQSPLAPESEPPSCSASRASLLPPPGAAASAASRARDAPRPDWSSRCGNAPRYHSDEGHGQRCRLSSRSDRRPLGVSVLSAAPKTRRPQASKACTGWWKPCVVAAQAPGRRREKRRCRERGSLPDILRERRAPPRPPTPHLNHHRTPLALPLALQDCSSFCGGPQGKPCPRSGLDRQGRLISP